MYCMSLDPGGTTGIVFVDDETAPWKLRVNQMGPEPHHKRLLDLLNLWNPKVIVCEGWDIRHNDAAQPIPLEYIGVVKAYAQGRKGLTQLVMQPAGTGLEFWDNDKLHKYGVYFPGKHARDACRHYLYYRTFTCKDQSLLKSIRP